MKPQEGQVVDPGQLPAWKMALDNMEQMQPRYLVELVRSGDLEKEVTARLDSYMHTMQRMKERSPQMPADMVQEIAQAEHLTPVNPNWQDQKPLSRAERAELRKYLRSLRKREAQNPETTS